MRIGNIRVLLGAVGLAGFVFLQACSSSVQFQVATQQPADNTDDLRQLAEQYYSASDPDEMRRVVARAGEVGPNSAIYHEVAADLAYLENRPFDQFDHLYQALLDPHNDVAAWHLRQIFGTDWRMEEWKRGQELFAFLAEKHPDVNVRSQARYYLASVLFRKGELDGVVDEIQQLGWQLPMALIGPFDNDQGKGFDIVYPPERELDLSKKYRGYNTDIAWIENPARGVLGILDVEELMYPDKWAVAYAASAFESTEAGDYELRVGTGDAAKIWVNGRLVFADKNITAYDFESIVVPIELQKGVNSILIKSAQGSGGWNLWARITGKDNARIQSDRLRAVRADAEYSPGLSAVEPLEAAAIISTAAQKIRPEGARALYWANVMASELGLGSFRSQLTEIYHQLYPKGIRAILADTFSAWSAGERAKTADLLEYLSENYGDEFLTFSVKQARYWRQNDLQKNARELLFKITEKYPERPEAWFELDDLFDNEDWQEDRCHLLEDLDRRYPDWPRIWNRRADCLSNLKLREQSFAIWERYVEELPSTFSGLKVVYSLAVGERNYRLAEKYARLMYKTWPNYYTTALQLAGVLEQQGKTDEAREILRRLDAQAPTAPRALYQLGQIDYIERKKDSAVDLWREALDRDPDNESLAHRLDFLAPEELGPWSVDAPSEERIEQVLLDRDSREYSSKADVALLLDHQVTALQSDGSTTGVVTTVVHALNVQGQDRITEHTLPRNGRTRVIHAFSVDPEGKRREASSIRGKEIRFRQMKVGSTVVLQYRLDTPPDEMIGSYFTTGWWFQSPRTEFMDSEYILWSPKGTTFGEYSIGEITRGKEVRGEYERHSWAAARTPVAVSEKSSVPAMEYLWQLALSTVPGWENFFNWEVALLKDAFRESPEVVALGEKIFKNAKTQRERLDRLQEHIATEVRYQQDYERFISGVKPHSAPMVLARGYGDCKDKSVLFITLARRAGIKSHLALVRTRGRGPVRKDVPMQQFNHAIVFVPKQEGIEADLFFDATADTLDLKLLRGDDTGTEALIIDEQEGRYFWKQIPYNNLDDNYTKETIDITLNKDGTAQGILALDIQGEVAAMLRRYSRNQEQLVQITQAMGNTLSPGTEVQELIDASLEQITSPAILKVSYSMPAFARTEGEELRFKIPLEGDPMSDFALEERTSPLNLGNPKKTVWNISVALPAGYKIERVPGDISVETECIQFKRKVRSEKGVVKAEQEIRYLCDRIVADEYASYRQEMQKISKAKDDDVVISKK